jgi:formyltetrahydrofolate deformylase
MILIRLLISCDDQAGIVGAVSSMIYEHGGNILDLQQHSLGFDNSFHMRIEFDISQLKVELVDFAEEFAERIAKKYRMNFRFTGDVKRMGILVSKYDHCLYDLLLRQQYGDLDVVIPLIISNHEDLWHVAESFGVEFLHLPIEYPENADKETKFKIKSEQEAKIIQNFDEYNIDFIAMARYMQILTPQIIQHYQGQIINVHHGFLPSFKGAKPYHQAYEKGVKIIGATAHYATEDLDMGPIISQDVINVSYRDGVESYVSKGRDIEKRVLASAVNAHASDKIIVENGRTIVFD